jgi:hypothetical protein
METKILSALVSIAAALFVVACAKSPIPPGAVETQLPPDSLKGTWGLADIIHSSEYVPPVLPYDGVGISVDVLSSAIAPGPNAPGRIVVHYNYYGCDSPSGEEVGDVVFEGIFLRRQGEWDWNTWMRLSPVKRGAVTEILEIPDSTPPASNYVVTVWSQTSGFQCWGNSNTFPINSTSDELDFRVIRPHRGAQWQKGTRQTIIWSFANLDMEVPNGNLENAFKVELLNGIEFSDGVTHPIWEIPSTGMSCHGPSRICSLPWIVPDNITSKYYRIRITPSGSHAVGFTEWLYICDDCATHEALTDVWVEKVSISTADGRFDNHAEVDYYTDTGSTSVQFHVGLGFNGEDPPSNCEFTAATQLGRRVDGEDVFPASFPVDRYNSWSGSDVGFDRVIHASIALPPGLTPGDTIPIRVRLILGHAQLPAYARTHLEVCEPERNTGNNIYDFSVTLRDAGSRT